MDFCNFTTKCKNVAEVRYWSLVVEVKLNAPGTQKVQIRTSAAPDKVIEKRVTTLGKLNRLLRSQERRENKTR